MKNISLLCLVAAVCCGMAGGMHVAGMIIDFGTRGDSISVFVWSMRGSFVAAYFSLAVLLVAVFRFLKSV